MGCDLHGTIETRDKRGGLYKCECILNRPNRNYRIFSVMADVRNSFYIRPISKPRGLPKDITRKTFLTHFRFGLDAHSESYLSYQEMKSIITRSCDPCYKAILAYMGVFEKDGYETRIVFWFDS